MAAAPGAALVYWWLGSGGGIALGPQRRHQYTMALQVGDSAPLFSDPDIFTGETFNLGDHEGKCVLVAFHGITWCPPCQFAAPILQELWDEEFALNPQVQFVIVSVNETPNAEALAELGFTIPWLADPAIPVAYQIGNAVPHYFFLNHELQVYKIQSGVFSSVAAEQKAAVRAAIHECLEGLPPKPKQIDVGRWAAVQTILAGVIQGGGGLVFKGGKIIKVPPDPPPFLHLSPAKKDILLALATHELANLVTDREARGGLQSAAADAIAKGARGLAHGAESPVHSSGGRSPAAK